MPYLISREFGEKVVLIGLLETLLPARLGVWLERADSKFSSHLRESLIFSLEGARVCILDSSLDSLTMEKSESESEANIVFWRSGFTMFSGDNSVKGTTEKTNKMNTWWTHRVNSGQL